MDSAESRRLSRPRSSRALGTTDLLQLPLSPRIRKTPAQLIEALPAMQHDPNRPEHVLKVDADDDGVGGDDAADALKYLVRTKVRQIYMRKLVGV